MVFPIFIALSVNSLVACMSLRVHITSVFKSALASHWLDDCENFTPTPEEQQPIQRQLLLVQYKQQANPHLSIHNYNPLVISRNDKNKQLTLLSQRKLALTARNTLFAK
jgi:hypothetical protein